MNIKLVKLTVEYKKQLTDMMDEWLAVEKDFSPYAIRKNDYHDFEYYLENLETKEGEKPGLVPDSVYFFFGYRPQYFCRCCEYSPLFKRKSL